MTTAGGTSDSSEPSVSLPKLNTLAIVSIGLVAVAAMGIAVGSRSWSWGIFFGGPLVLAIPAVGAGHAALQQINVRRERGPSWRTSLSAFATYLRPTPWSRVCLPESSTCASERSELNR